jgi:hypothetical protein
MAPSDRYGQMIPGHYGQKGIPVKWASGS